MATIRIDEEVYLWLKSQAIPFEDTPNSVLRRLAGLDKNPMLVKDESNGSNTLKDQGGNPKMVQGKTKLNLSGRLSGKILARLWHVNVKHALYHKDGKWYNHLRDFPGALFDPNGYVIFHGENEYINSPYLQHGQELHVINGLPSIPTYKRMR